MPQEPGTYAAAAAPSWGSFDGQNVPAGSGGGSVMLPRMTQPTSGFGKSGERGAYSWGASHTAVSAKHHLCSDRCQWVQGGVQGVARSASECGAVLSSAIRHYLA